MQTSELAHWLAINAIFSHGKILDYYRRFGSLHAIFDSSKQELMTLGFTEKQALAITNPDWRRIEFEIAWAQQTNHACITLVDEDYPAILKEIPDPPLVLYVQGNVSAFRQKNFAIVGTRYATIQGKLNTESFAMTLSEVNFVIVSGMARGIDAAAHQATLKAKGMTIAVAGTGLNHVYPREHRRLAAEIVANNGALISEFPLDTSPLAHHFPRRNRIIAGLAKGVLVVEAALKSGSLITAKHALDYGRDVFAIPGSIHQPLAKGCHHLIQQGAKLCQSANDILEEYGIESAQVEAKKLSAQRLCAQDLSKEEQSVLNKIGNEITPIDMIILRSRLTASEVSSILLALELQGYIKCVTGGYLRIFSN